MSIPTKLLFSLLSSFVFYLSSNSLAFAASEFTTDFTSTYRVQLDGNTQVSHRITLTNLMSHLYPTEYSLLVGSNKLDNILVTQDDTPLEPRLDLSDQTTLITLGDLTPVIGKDRQTTLNFSYLTPDIAEHLDRTWSINIPRLARAGEAGSYTRTVLTPAELGTPNAQFPPATSVSIDPDTGSTKLVFHGHPTSSLTILFGDSEYYELNLTYEIDNPTLSSADTELALPPDTAYQKVLLDRLDPAPRQIRLDQDGNWLAVYPLVSKEKLTVHARLYLQVFPLPQSSAELLNPKSLTKAQPFWETDNNQIQELAAQLNSPENIYNYLIGNLTYDYTRVTDNAVRLGAATALTQKASAICTEYTDTFIALSRALGIPARGLVGYAYTTNPSLRPVAKTADVLHSWPEYYDQTAQTWIQLDPTWGATTGGIDYFHKLDYNHLAFVIHGKESAYPIPAGAYKKDPQLSTVAVKLTSSIPETKLNLEELTLGSGLVVKNRGNVGAVHPQAGYLPPLGEASLSPSILGANTSLPRLYPWILFLLIILFVFLFLRHLKHKKPS